MITGGVDLHLHSTASDGTQTPRAVVAEAAERGVTLLALTDHDTLEGVPEAVAAGRELGVHVVPGAELSVETETRDIHVLGFFLRGEDTRAQRALSKLREARNQRNARILERLRALGLPVDPARLQEISGTGSVGRPHIAAAMVEAGHVGSQNEAFYRYLGRGKPAYVPRASLEVSKALSIVKEGGGLAVIAHPAKIGSLQVIEEVIALGVDGLEVFHTDHDLADSQMLLGLTKRHNLLVTGGTDSHGPSSDRSVGIGSVTMPAWVGERFVERAPGWWREE